MKKRQCVAGDLVTVRGARWRVIDVRRFERCAVVSLQGATAKSGHVERRVVTPFDVLEAVDSTRTPRFVSSRMWRSVCRALVYAETPPGCLRSASAARFDLLPHQLEPALAVVRGLATRVLLADEVGLGKTVQAGLVAAELRQRGVCDRTLVIAPAGLRDQWSRELAERFAIDAAVVDGPLLRRLASAMPVGMNPWQAIPTAIASIDYVKRAEVLPAVAACVWDLLVVDEAHGVNGDSDRHAAVQALAASAPYVLLLTATPHSGDDRAFASLCGVGAVDQAPLVIFRRTRAQIGIGVRRRVHLVAVRASVDERRMHALLARYADAIRRERAHAGAADPALALSVLHKRAFSSAWSLAESIERRLGALEASAARADNEQLMLPLDDPTGDLVRADEPPPWPADLRLADSSRERQLLTTVLSAARIASSGETKLLCLARLLRRVRESIVVFTEYRDTLAHVRSCIARATMVLHGGLAGHERAAALEAFVAAPGAVLLATDAAAEGLNLHHHCRAIVNLELPWNPMRLEQRIGRVDRIGQRRTVHAFHLISAGTGEMRVADRLRQRLAAAAAAIEVANPLESDERVARAVLGQELDDFTDAD